MQWNVLSARPATETFTNLKAAHIKPCALFDSVPKHFCNEWQTSELCVGHESIKNTQTHTHSYALNYTLGWGRPLARVWPIS